MTGSKSSLRRHIPELAVDWARDEPDRLWRVVDGTLCFADISGFTALAERLSQHGRVGGEELIETLSRVFGGMLESSRAYDGTLLKFGGDALLFLFRGERHALRAANAAVEMRRELRKAAEERTSVGRLRLSMSVGLHSGPLHFFLVGSSHRELILAGPDVSRVTETEGSADAGQIAVSSATSAALPGQATRARDDGTLLLRWRKPTMQPTGPVAVEPTSPAILRQLMPRALGEFLDAGPPEPEHRIACIAFVRFSGTDSILTQDGPDALAAALQSTVATAQKIFEAEGITLLTIDIDDDGGKLFLSAGVPIAGKDSEGRMLQALRRLADEDMPLPLQFGVNRGHVFVAEVGTGWRAAYSAMGDTTNTAARICAKAPPGKIYCHPSVLVESRPTFATEQVGPFTFKGKTTPQTLYAVGNLVGRQKDPKEHGESVTARQAERRILDAAVSNLSNGIGECITIVGDTGLGKSSLVDMTLEHARELPVIRVFGESFRVSNPYGMLREPVSELLGITSGTPADQHRQLIAAIERLDPESLPLAALVGDVVQVPVEPSEDVAEIEVGFRPDRTADVLLKLVAAARPGPLVMSVEDADWADDVSAHLLQRLAGACKDNGWLMLVTRRNETGGFSPDCGTRLKLEPLSAADIEQLVIEQTAAAPLRPHEVALVVSRSGGNPQFAAEIIRAARKAGSFDAIPGIHGNRNREPGRHAGFHRTTDSEIRDRTGHRLFP